MSAYRKITCESTNITIGEKIFAECKINKVDLGITGELYITAKDNSVMKDPTSYGHIYSIRYKFIVKDNMVHPDIATDTVYKICGTVKTFSIEYPDDIKFPTLTMALTDIAIEKKTDATKCEPVVFEKLTDDDHMALIKKHTYDICDNHINACKECPLNPGPYGGCCFKGTVDVIPYR